MLKSIVHKWKYLAALLIVLLATGAGVVLALWQPPTSDTNTRVIAIPQGASIRQVSVLLQENGLVRNALLFETYARITGKATSIQAGSFRLSSHLYPDQILSSLQSGALDVWVQIKEGVRSEEIASLLQEKLPLAYRTSWRDALKQHEGYLFPDTYLFPVDASIDVIVSTMRANFDKKFQQAKAQQTFQGLSDSDAVILASLVEREGNDPAVMRLIASVLENRLSIGMPLQIDATIQYALGYQPQEGDWWKKIITYQDLRIQSPYNTYQNPGLPPGPIANPGLTALAAVLNPAETNYFYYVADKAGNTYFSETLEEHNEKVVRYTR